MRACARTPNVQCNAMSNTTNTKCDTTAISQNLRNLPASKTHDTAHKYVTASPSKEVVLLSQGDVVEVTVKREGKAKGRGKCTSPAVSSGHRQKAEKMRSTINDDEAPQNWGRVFSEQNLLYMKQTQPSMSAKYSENKKTREHVGAKRQQTNHVDPVLLKRTSCQKKLGDNSKTPCCHPILVQDRAVQHPDIADNANRFAEFNPVRALRFLMKELKDLIKNDKRSSEIFTEMEQILSKMPVDSGKLFGLEDLEMKLQTSTVQLKESGKKMKVMCELWASEREKLNSQIKRQDIDLKEANQRQANLETEIKVLTQQLEVATQSVKDEQAALRRQVKKDELSEKLILDLRTEVAKQTELARKNYINNQYLTIERDKLSQLSSYQKTLITKYQHTIKELQAQVAEQLKALSEARTNEENATSSPISLTQTGFVCSSPTSSFSDRSNKSWHDLSDVSSVPSRHVLSKEDVPVKGSVHLELVSLEESSRDIMFESCQNQVTADEGTVAQNNDNDTIIREANAKDAILEKRKEKSSDSTKAHSLDRDVLKISRGIASDKLISDMRKQDDIQSRIPINVPSPLREYPCPDWSDSSLSSVSTASDLEIVLSNGV